MRRSVPFWVVLLASLLLLTGCRTAAPYAGAGKDPRRATIVGRVVGPLGAGPLAGRLISAVEVTSGARYSTKTHVSGGFTLLVPPGRYRLDLALARAERVVEDAGLVEVDPGSSSRMAVIVVGGAGMASGE